MQLTRRLLMAGVTGAAMLTALPALAETVVNVSLWDKGADMAMPDNLGFAMGDDTSGATMGVELSQESVPAGAVRFVVTNDSKDTIHEMIISPVPADGSELPYVADEMRVDEDAAGHLGEVAELDPGASGELVLTLKPGKYIAFCNIPGHYMAGMWALLTVTE